MRFNSAANVPLVRESYKDLELVRAGLLKDPCLMGVFPPPVLDIIISPINMISSVGTHLGYPWVIPNPSKVQSYGDVMPLSPAELSYCVIQSETPSDVYFW